MRPSRPPSSAPPPLAVALTGGLLTGVPGAAAAAAAAATTVAVSSHEIDVHRRPGRRPDVCTVVYDLYRPSTRHRGDTRSRRSSPPTASAAPRTTRPTSGRRSPSAGYVVLSYSGLGFGGSDCKITLDDPDYDGKAAKQLVTYLGGGKPANDGSRVDYVRTDARSHDGVRRRHDPRVGMVGGSYGGQVQFAVAGIDPRVDTIVPIITWNDLSYSLAPNNTELHDPTGRASATARPGTREGRLDQRCSSASASPTASSTPRPTRPATSAAPTSPTRPASPRRRWTRSATRPRTTLDLRPARQRLVVRRRGSGIPTLLDAGRERHAVQPAGGGRDLPRAAGPGHAGEDDLAVVGAQRRRHAGTGRARHGASPRASYEGSRVIDWFDHYLKDRKVGRPAREFTYFRDWVAYSGIATPAYGTSSPLPGRHDPGPLPVRHRRPRHRRRPPCRPAARPTPTPPARCRPAYSEVSALQGVAGAGRRHAAVRRTRHASPPGRTKPLARAGRLGRRADS